MKAVSIGKGLFVSRLEAVFRAVERHKRSAEYLEELEALDRLLSRR
ncbi:hypothetical protein HYY74_05225 [Candidatus Woesearchaeota archaeon]|nr:hypothetical protein [Candidatus Woesearchaeota archaeon]